MQGNDHPLDSSSVFDLGPSGTCPDCGHATLLCADLPVAAEGETFLAGIERCPECGHVRKYRQVRSEVGVTYRG